jgi:predicted O-linked N-acetylglucosamine transferase (SPINDLY family)
MTSSTHQLKLSALAAHRAGRLADAEKLYREVLRRNPDDADALNLLGVLLHQTGSDPDPARWLRRSIQINPGNLQAHANLALIELERRNLAAAQDACEAALKLNPKFDRARLNLSGALFLQGRVTDAVQQLRAVLAADPRHVRAASILLYYMHFQPGVSRADLLREHQAWAAAHADPLTAQAAPHVNDLSPDRVLRVGYVSAGFREHPIGRAMLPLLARHDARAFGVFCYSDEERPDAMNARLKSYVTHWRNITGLSNESVANLVRSDRIDILVDLSLHMEGQRLLAFALKPAPVQVNFIGYAATSGLRAIDYRLTDRYLDPAGESDPFNTEKLVRLPHCFYCYVADGDEPEPAPPPCETNGFITFGSLNFPPKISEPAMDLWARCLDAVPKSRLMLVTHTNDHETHFGSAFASRGIDPARLEIVRPQPRLDYLRLYHRIDIALDPFPYNGGVTTCDALWMGIPVVTLPGETSLSRAGLSLLSNLGLQELIATSGEDYLRIVTDLAADHQRLAAYHATLRARMRLSPITDAVTFTREVEAMYRALWCTHCREMQLPREP